jgi:hypothetical protein
VVVEVVVRKHQVQTVVYSNQFLEQEVVVEVVVVEVVEVAVVCKLVRIQFQTLFHTTYNFEQAVVLQVRKHLHVVEPHNQFLAQVQCSC